MVMSPTIFFFLFEAASITSLLIVGWIEFCGGKGLISPRNLGFMPLVIGLPTLGELLKRCR